MLRTAANHRFTTTLLDSNFEPIPAALGVNTGLREGTVWDRTNAEIVAACTLDRRGFVQVYPTGFRWAGTFLRARREGVTVPAYVDVERATFAPNSNQVEGVESFTFALVEYAGGIYGLEKVA